MIRRLLVIAVLLLVACDRGEQPTRIGIAIPSQVHAIAWSAKDSGLAADVQVMGGSAAAVRMLVAGEIDVALAGGDSVLKANWAGADLVVLASFVDRFYHRIVVKRGFGEPKNLSGKKIGLPFLGGPQDMAAAHALAKHGLAYGKDVEVVSLGKEMNLIAALSRGDIDATTSELPPKKLEELGLEVLVDLPAEPVSFPYLVMAARRDAVDKDAPRLRTVLGALCDAAARLRDSSRREANLVLLRKHLRSELDELDTSLLALPPEPTRAAFETVAKLSKRNDGLDRIVDRRVLDPLLAEGRCK